MQYFGTDGIRKRAELFTPHFIDRIAYAAAVSAKSKEIIIGRDTRVSGEDIESLLSEGLKRRGITAVLTGIVPTPVLAYYTRLREAAYGIMITASHNPPEYNGIKFFASDGSKLPEEEEFQLETLINTSEEAAERGGIIITGDAVSEYIAYLKSVLNPDIQGLNVLLDTANGAAAIAAPKVFKEFGASVTVINAQTDGVRINEHCGATHPEVLIEAMALGKWDIGFTYDGDADRVMAVKGGRLFDGDRIMYAAARYFQEQGKLKVPAAVGTVMTNLGAEQAFEKRGIRFIRAKVGDKYVSEEMKKNNCSLGGEASGHLIFTDYQNTGDGLLSSLLTAEIDNKKGLIELDDIVEYPQVSDDILTVPEKISSFKSNKEIEGYLKGVQRNTDIRIVVRASGTEPRIRIMAEAPSREKAASIASDIKNYILERI